jgi:RNA polymerase sigma-70 factor (ECF subfamily)
MVARFVEAASAGDMDGLLNLLAEDVTLWTDGGGKAVRGAATRPLHGRDTVATFLMATRRWVDAEAIRLEIAEVNGETGVIMREHGKPRVVMTFEVGGGKIRAMRFIGNPDKLKRV